MQVFRYETKAILLYDTGAAKLQVTKSNATYMIETWGFWGPLLGPALLNEWVGDAGWGWVHGEPLQQHPWLAAAHCPAHTAQPQSAAASWRKVSVALL